MVEPGRGKRKSGRSVSTTEAFRFFRNIFYTGMFDYNGERHIGKHKSMITLDEYQHVQDIIDGRKRVFKQRNNFYFMKLLQTEKPSTTNVLVLLKFLYMLDVLKSWDPVTNSILMLMR